MRAAPQAFKRFQLSDHTRYRLLEILPGALVWLTFGLAVILSFVAPIWAVGFILVFDLYWLIRAVYNLTYLVVAYRRFRRSQRVDWRARLSALPEWGSLHHLVVIPIYREPYEVVRQSFEGLVASNYPLERLFVVFACEERDRPRVDEVVEKISTEFGHRFGDFLVTFHPGDVAGEVAGKGSNIAWAGRRAKERIDQRGIAYDRVLVTSLDVDTVVDRQYFAYLTHTFLNHPNRYRTSYQPLPLFHNNLWESPPLTRIVAMSTTFWLMTETVRPDRLFTFSSHSMPFTALVDVDFWQNDIVTEDSRIFLQCLVAYDGDYSVTPMYVGVSMDTVATRSFRRTVTNQYKQQRRWAYGVENFPYMVWNFSVNRDMPLMKKIKYIWNQLEGVYSWATAPILIFLLGWLPIQVAEARGDTRLIVQSAPDILQALMVSAMIGLVVAAGLSTLMVPSSAHHRGWRRIVPMILQWLLLPITMIAFGSIPATDAQTRLMLGRYLGFWVTEKTRRPGG